MFDLNFTWSDWNPNVYNLVIVDQFQISKFDKNSLIKVIQQKELACYEKITGKKKIVIIRCPMIFMSVYELDKDLAPYFTIVNADDKGKDGIYLKI